MFFSGFAVANALGFAFLFSHAVGAELAGGLIGASLSLRCSFTSELFLFDFQRSVGFITGLIFTTFRPCASEVPIIRVP
jgi:hypothetical protein